MVFCYQNCSNILWGKIGLMIVEICRVHNFLVSSHFENQQYLLNVGFREFGEFTGYFPPNSQTGTQWVDFVFELVFYFLYLPHTGAHMFVCTRVHVMWKALGRRSWPPQCGCQSFFFAKKFLEMCVKVRMCEISHVRTPARVQNVCNVHGVAARVFFCKKIFGYVCESADVHD